jgi:hypothetical protein
MQRTLTTALTVVAVCQRVTVLVGQSSSLEGSWRANIAKSKYDPEADTHETNRDLARRQNADDHDDGHERTRSEGHRIHRAGIDRQRLSARLAAQE